MTIGFLESFCQRIFALERILTGFHHSPSVARNELRWDQRTPFFLNPERVGSMRRIEVILTDGLCRCDSNLFQLLLRIDGFLVEQEQADPKEQRKSSC